MLEINPLMGNQSQGSACGSGSQPRLAWNARTFLEGIFDYANKKERLTEVGVPEFRTLGGGEARRGTGGGRHIRVRDARVWDNLENARRLGKERSGSLSQSSSLISCPKTASLIVEKGADYVMPVKGNHQDLLDDLQAFDWDAAPAFSDRGANLRPGPARRRR